MELKRPQNSKINKKNTRNYNFQVFLLPTQKHFSSRLAYINVSIRLILNQLRQYTFDRCVSWKFCLAEKRSVVRVFTFLRFSHWSLELLKLSLKTVH